MPDPKIDPKDLEALLDAAGVGKRTKKNILRTNSDKAEAKPSKKVVGQGANERPEIALI